MMLSFADSDADVILDFFLGLQINNIKINNFQLNSGKISFGQRLFVGFSE
jgi:hypothetical protein